VLERYSHQERRIKEQEALIQELHRKEQSRRESVDSSDYHHTKVAGLFCIPPHKGSRTILYTATQR
jgi:hypothetical protein